MAPNYLLINSEQLATDTELLCQRIHAPTNTLFQIRKSSSSVYANIREANYGQSKADMLSKFEIALKECNETEGWLQLLFNTKAIDEATFKKHRNLCGRIRRMLISSCKTLKEGKSTVAPNNAPVISPPSRKEIELHGCIEVPPDTTLDDFTDAFLSWVESKGWSFGGGFREIVDDHYVNRDGSVGKHVSEE